MGLTLGGLFWGARRLVLEHRGLVRDLDEIQRIANDPTLDDDERKARRLAVLQPSSTWGDVFYLREWVRRFVVQQAMGSLGPPALLTVAGIVGSTVASVWSLWA
ncbi:hypothetical protein ACU686_02900 [Yinghuangia aomiensis]